MNETLWNENGKRVAVLLLVRSFPLRKRRKMRHSYLENRFLNILKALTSFSVSAGAVHGHSFSETFCLTKKVKFFIYAQFLLILNSRLREIL